MRLILAGFCMLAMFTASVQAAGELSGRRAPGFALPDVQGQFHDLADHKGKIVLIDFMQTTCPHCQALTPILEQVKARFPNQVAILGVVVPPDTPQTVTRYIATYGATNPILFDCGQMTASYLKPDPKNPQVTFPHLFLVDGDGQIRNDFSQQEVGQMSADQLSDQVQRLLAPQGSERSR